MPEEKSIKQIKEIVRQILQERYSDEGIDKIEITQMDCDSISWSVWVEVSLKKGDKKSVTLHLDRAGNLEKLNG